MALNTYPLLAQPCGVPPLPPCDPGPPVPISGIEFLIGAGALFGVKQFVAKRKIKT